MKTVIIDYGAGNVQSVLFALERLGVNGLLSKNHDEILSADKVIFPGVGHAAHAMKQIEESGVKLLIPALKQPVLGICLGMQLMCRFSEEGNTPCLGIFDDTVKRFDNRLKVPHMGWNTVKNHSEQAFWASSNDSSFYFVHSYYVPKNKFTTLSCEYGISFSAALRKDNFYAVQFHPEKSAVAGALLLKTFLEV
jgi:glutamine amidotransferase